MKSSSNAVYGKIDRTVQSVFKWLMYIGAGALIFVMLVAFIDVLIAKIFGSSIPSATEIIQYCDVLLAFLGMGYTLLIGQMTSVDILFGKLPKKLQNVLNMIYDVLGFGFCIFFGKLSWDNMMKFMTNNTMSNPKGGFPVWPFAGVETLSWFVLAIAFALCFLRFCFRFVPEPDILSSPKNTEGGDTQ